MNSPILQIQDISFSYDRETVLHSISMDVNPGEFVGVIGPNGSGKSTLLKLLGGVLTSNSGKLFFCVKKCFFRESPPRRRRAFLKMGKKRQQ